MYGMSVNGAPPRVRSGDLLYKPVVLLRCGAAGCGTRIVGYIEVHDPGERGQLPVVVARLQFLTNAQARPIDVIEVPVVLDEETPQDLRTFCAAHGWLDTTRDRLLNEARRAFAKFRKVGPDHDMKPLALVLRPGDSVNKEPAPATEPLDDATLAALREERARAFLARQAERMNSESPQ